jgi:hypothetical protein
MLAFDDAPGTRATILSMSVRLSRLAVSSASMQTKEAVMRRFCNATMYIFCVLIGSFAINDSSTAADDSAKRPILVFSIDQGFPNGPVENDDLASLQREISYLKLFRPKYDIFALLAGDIRDKSHLQSALDLLAKNRMPFFLEAASSDAITIDVGTAPYDRSHGLELSVAQLQQYKGRYGDYFRGIRLFELFEGDWTIWASKYLGKDWGDRFKNYWPQDDFYQTSLIEPYVKFAADNNMVVIFADWFWYFNHQWAPADLKQQQHERELRSLIQRYPNVVIVVYDNNEPANHSSGVDWAPTFRQYLSYGAKGFGLSDQAWLCDSETKCPVNQLISWATAAFRDGAMLVQTEPYWYWWDFPRGELQLNNYEKYKSAAERGNATDNLIKFSSALGIDIAGPDGEQRQWDR